MRRAAAYFFTPSQFKKQNETTAGLDHIQGIVAIVSATCNTPGRELAE